jgi:hypothetical protein
MIDKEEMLKLASEIEALSDEDLSGISISSLYSRLKKEAELSVDEDSIREAIVGCIDSMREYSL